MSKLLDRYIRIEPGFQKSINLAYDLADETKVSDFIPSSSSIEILESLLLETYPNSTDRAKILIGPYGKGKSHIILVLLSLLKVKDKTIFDRVLKSIQTYNQDLYEYVNSYIDSDRKLLPVIIQGSNSSLTQSFLNAIQNALNEEHLEGIMPDTHFQAAIKHINIWEQQYADTYNQFKEAIEPESIDNFMYRLMKFDSSAYEQFVELYPKLSAGGIFNPFGGVDVVELYSNVVESLTKIGYNGLFVVYDEFSKYLEANIKDTSVSDIKMLQDFAEKCNRSKNNQLHLLLIAHKDIENYIDILPKNRVDGWRGVSERFTHIEMSSDYAQTYEVMGQAIRKIPEFYTEYVSNNESIFSNLSNYVESNKLFSELSNKDRSNLCKTCFPLHPLTTFILPRLSELVAQNERTLFTFISDNGKFSLSSLISRVSDSNEIEEIITADAVYDYFEPLLKKEIYTSYIYQLYALVNKILIKVKDSALQAKIIKIIALIYLINQFEKIEPIQEEIIGALPSYSPKEIIQALKDLQENQFVIYAKKSNGYYRLKSPSNKNLQLEINQEVNKVKASESVISILQDYANDIYFYPTGYNEEKSIVRYFDLKFISAKDVLAVDDWELKLTFSKADGVVYAVIPSNAEEHKTVKERLLSINSPSNRAVFIINKKFNKQAEDELFLYKAVKNTLASNKDDEAIVSEIEIIRDDLEEVVISYINSLIKPELGNSIFIHNNKKVKILRKSHLSALLSNICFDVYSKTPIIVNETINKNELTSTAKNSRAKLIKNLLVNKLQPMLGLNRTSQEAAIARSVLCETGIIANFQTVPTFNHEISPNVSAVLDCIEKFIICSGKEPQNFEKLYEELTSPAYHIGLKRGLIPIFIAIVAHKYLEQLTLITNDTEIELSEKTLSYVNDEPEKFKLRYETISENKTAFINKLQDLFSDYIKDSNNSQLNHQTLLCNAMQRWFISLPKYAKEIKSIYSGKNSSIPLSRSDMQFSSALKNPSLNSYEFLFNKLPQIYGKSIDDNTLIDEIKLSKNKYDSALDHLINGLIEDMKSVFDSQAHKESSLSSIIKDWYEALNSSTTEHVFDEFNTVLLEQCSHIDNDESSFIKNISKTICGLRIDDWSSQSIELFNNSIENFKNTIDEYNNSSNSEQIETKGYVLTKIDPKGNTIRKTFDKVECSSMAKLLKNEITNSLDEMGQAISTNEKRQVLLDILESLC